MTRFVPGFFCLKIRHWGVMRRPEVGLCGKNGLVICGDGAVPI